METLYFLPYWLTPLWMQGSSSALTLSVFSLSQNTAKTLSARIPPYLMCNLCIVLHDEHNLINMQSLLVRRAHSLWWIFLESSGPTVDLREEYPWKGGSVTVSAMIMLEEKKTCPHFEKSATSWTVDCVKLVDDFSTVTSNQSHRFCCELLNVLISQIQSTAKVKTLHCYITTRAKHGTHWTNSKTGFFPLVNNKLPSRGRETESVQMCKCVWDFLKEQ